MQKYGRVWMAIILSCVMAMMSIASVTFVNSITVEAGSVRLSKKSLSMKVGQTRQLKVKGTKKVVKWTVSNKKIIKVTKKGKVTAKKVGNAKVYAKVRGKKLTCKIKVTAPRSKPTTTTGTAITAIPLETSVPTATNTPNGTEEFGQNSIPEVTKAPLTAMDEIKVGDTKITTGAGVRITYTAEQNLLIIKMENTTKSAKAVSVTIDFLDSARNIVSDSSCIYPESISHLSAGQTYYAFAQCADSCNVASYGIEKLTVSNVSTTEVDCLSDIKVTSEEEMKDGKYTGITELTYEYIGNNVSKINGKSVHVYGSVVYYNVDDYIVDFFNIRETIKISGENNKTTGYSFSLDENVDHYAIILSGAEYSSGNYEYDG